MVTLPLQLSARWRLLGAEVAEVFAALAAEINGKIGSEHFAPHAAIPNALKQQPRSVALVQARLDIAGGAGVYWFPALAPKRYLTSYAADKTIDAWEPVGLSLVIGDGGPLVTGSLQAPFGFGAVQNIANLNAGVELWLGGDFTDPATGMIQAALTVGVVNVPLHDVVLTAWFLTRHQR